ncbi:hypothetical protein D3C71_21860 [compost metagenome]
MNKLTPNIDLDLEVSHMAKYIAQKWTPIAGLEAMFAEIRDAAVHAARGWMESHTLSLRAHELRKARQEQLIQALPQGEGATAAYYDGVSHFLSEVSFKDMRICEAARDVDGRWDYSRKVAALTSSLSARYPQLAAARPLGWDALAENYVDFDGQEEYDPTSDRALFEGTEASGACSGDFVYRTALPYVMYDEICQGNKASHVLVGSVFAQFLTIQERLNAQRAVAALEQLAAGAAPQLLLEWTPQVENLHLKAIVALMEPVPTREQYEEALAQRKAWDALSEEERQARREDNSESIAKLLANLKSENDTEKWAAEKAEALRVVREVFGA